MYLGCKFCGGEGMRDALFLDETSRKIRSAYLVCSCSGLPRPHEGAQPGEREITLAEAKVIQQAEAGNYSRAAA